MRAGVLLLSLLLPSIAVTSCFGLTQGAVDPLIAHLASRLRPPGDAIPDPPTQFRPGPRDITALAASLSQDPDGRSAIAALLDTVFTAYEASAKGSNQENDLAGALAFNIAVNFAASSNSLAASL